MRIVGANVSSFPDPVARRVAAIALFLTKLLDVSLDDDAGVYNRQAIDFVSQQRLSGVNPCEARLTKLDQPLDNEHGDGHNDAHAGGGAARVRGEFVLIVVDGSPAVVGCLGDTFVHNALSAVHDGVRAVHSDSEVDDEENPKGGRVEGH